MKVALRWPLLTATDREQGPPFARLGPHVGGARVMSRVSCVGKIYHHFPGFVLDQQRGQCVDEEGRLLGRIGLTGHGRDQFVAVAESVE